MTLSPDQFGSQPWGHAVPLDANGSGLSIKPDPDAPPRLALDSPEHFAKVVKGKTAHRYTDDGYKRTKVARWQLDRGQDTTTYPVGWDGPVH